MFHWQHRCSGKQGSCTERAYLHCSGSVLLQSGPLGQSLSSAERSDKRQKEDIALKLDRACCLTSPQYDQVLEEGVQEVHYIHHTCVTMCVSLLLL